MLDMSLQGGSLKNGELDGRNLISKLYTLHFYEYYCFDCFDDLRPDQHCFSHFRARFCLSDLNQYLEEDKVSCILKFSKCHAKRCVCCAYYVLKLPLHQL